MSNIINNIASGLATKAYENETKRPCKRKELEDGEADTSEDA